MDKTEIFIEKYKALEEKKPNVSEKKFEVRRK